jgi:SAM-dependent methyltransferase
MPEGPGEALDFGAGEGYMGLLASQKGFQVTAVDILSVSVPYDHPNLSFVKGDLRRLNLGDNTFDLIINCSAIEHVGLAGRYDMPKDPDGDLDAMSVLRSIAKPEGKMLLTVPIGKDRIFAPLHRVYGEERLPKLLAGWKVLKEQYWLKDNHNRWIIVEKAEALNNDPSPHFYGLGLFALQRLKDEDTDAQR